jgi:large subunit ribosomal protein L24
MNRKYNERPRLKLRKGDLVLVVAGESKGQQGKVLEVLVAENRAIVERVNLVARHTKPNAKNTQGGIVHREAPVHVSNLMLLDPKTGKPTRVGRRPGGDGKLERFARKSGEAIKS